MWSDMYTSCSLTPILATIILFSFLECRVYSHMFVYIILCLHSPNTTILARVPHTDLYKDKGLYPTVQEIPSIKIFRIDASLYYANVEHFRKKLYKLTEGNALQALQFIAYLHWLMCSSKEIFFWTDLPHLTSGTWCG